MIDNYNVIDLLNEYMEVENINDILNELSQKQVLTGEKIG